MCYLLCCNRFYIIKMNYNHIQQICCHNYLYTYLHCSQGYTGGGVKMGLDSESTSNIEFIGQKCDCQDIVLHSAVFKSSIAF